MKIIEFPNGKQVDKKFDDVKVRVGYKRKLFLSLYFEDICWIDFFPLSTHVKLDVTWDEEDYPKHVINYGQGKDGKLQFLDVFGNFDDHHRNVFNKLIPKINEAINSKEFYLREETLESSIIGSNN